MAHVLRLALLWHRFGTGEDADPKFYATMTSIMYARQIFAKHGFKLEFRPVPYRPSSAIVHFDGKIDFNQAGYTDEYADKVSDKFPAIDAREHRLPVVFARSRFDEEVADVEAGRATISISGIYCKYSKKKRKPYVMVSDEGYGPHILAHEIGHAAGLDHIASSEPEWADPLNVMSERSPANGLKSNFTARQVTALRGAYFCATT